MAIIYNNLGKNNAVFKHKKIKRKEFSRKMLTSRYEYAIIYFTFMYYFRRCKHEFFGTAYR